MNTTCSSCNRPSAVLFLWVPKTPHNHETRYAFCKGCASLMKRDVQDHIRSGITREITHEEYLVWDALEA